MHRSNLQLNLRQNLIFTIRQEILILRSSFSALTNDNKVCYQNGLTPKNAPFALAADSLFTNYKWTEERLNDAKITGERYGLHPTETYFGIDVWAQNTDMPGPPRRITFPPKGGGGTNTGLVRPNTSCFRPIIFIFEVCAY